MNPENAIEVRNITKSFKVFLDKGHTLKELTLFKKRRQYETRAVLNGISFDVKKGEAVGLIGQNGCGKSTTLKLLTRIMYPDSGTIELRGRVSSLIELGAGFHPDMSGRQNIYTNASIFGLTKKEIDARVNDIIAFSELEEFIDNPVRTYSSGMYMRLAFAVAINVDADVLLIDEILAVGDIAFQAKCFNKLREIKAAGTTIVIVSHSLGQIEQICERSIWIHEGKIAKEGFPRDVHIEYQRYMGLKREEIQQKENQAQEKNEEQDDIDHAMMGIQNTENRWGNGKACINRVVFADKEGKEKAVFRCGEYMSIRVAYEIHEYIEDAFLGIAIYRNDGLLCYGTNTRVDGIKKINLSKDGEYIVDIQKLYLLPGEYSLDVAVEAGMTETMDYCRGIRKFHVYAEIGDEGICRLEHKWRLDNCC